MSSDSLALVCARPEANVRPAAQTHAEQQEDVCLWASEGEPGAGFCASHAWILGISLLRNKDQMMLLSSSSVSWLAAMIFASCCAYLAWSCMKWGMRTFSMWARGLSRSTSSYDT